MAFPHIKGSTQVIAHIGYPTHSFKAPMIYYPYFEQAGIDAVVVPMGVSVEHYAAFFPPSLWRKTWQARSLPCRTK